MASQIPTPRSQVLPPSSAGQPRTTTKHLPALVRAAFFALLLALVACDDHMDLTQLRGQQLTADLVPASPTNAYADLPAAAALGQRLFFDKRLSVDATVACVSCHAPDHGFSDPRPFSVGVRGQIGTRHAMPVAAVAFQPFGLWDGRVDSVWAQPIAAIENPAEMDLTRVELARLMASAYRSDYEALFGPLPELDDAPQRAKPGMAAWDALPEVVQQDVDRVSANVGKAIEAYERQLLCSDTKFDRWARGEEALSQREERGAQAFVQGGCVNCHSGPAFSDGKFHNIGLPSTDPGRSVGRTQLLANVFNGVGLFSDDPVAGQHKLTAAQAEGATVGAFKTPSLRGVGQRTFFGHASHQQTLAGFVQDVYRGGRGRRNATIGTLDPLLRGVNVPGNEVDDLVEFLHTLDCPPVPSHLVVR